MKAKEVTTDGGATAADRIPLAQLAAYGAGGIIPIALFNIAGVPQTQTPLRVLGVNFLGLRHVTETVLPLIPDGGAIANVTCCPPPAP